MAWWMVVVFIVSLVAAYAMMPKPQTQPPAGLGDIKAPTAEEGREIAVVFGTRDVQGPNVVYFGNLRTVAVKSSGGKK
jgi:hypothetical protein